MRKMFKRIFIIILFIICFFNSFPLLADSTENLLHWKFINPYLEPSMTLKGIAAQVYDLSCSYINKSMLLFEAIGKYGLYTWNEVNETLTLLKTPRFPNISNFTAYCLVEVDPVNPDVIYTSAEDFNSPSMFLISRDRGQTWEIHDTPNQNATERVGYMIRSIAIDLHNNSIIFCGTQNGVIKSVDGGESFETLSNGIKTQGFLVWTIAIDPRNSNLIYAGGEDQSKIINNQVIHEACLFKSTDGGISWTELTFPGWIPLDIAISPEDGTVFVATEGSGIYKSMNDGVSWISIGLGTLTSLDVTSIHLHPKNSSIIYIGTLSYVGGPGGVFKSIDGGETWKEVNDGLDAKEVGTIEISKDGNIIYAATGTYNSSTGYEGKGVYRALLGPKLKVNITLHPSYQIAQEDFTIFCIIENVGTATAYDINVSILYPNTFTLNPDQQSIETISSLEPGSISNIIWIMKSSSNGSRTFNIIVSGINFMEISNCINMTVVNDPRNDLENLELEYQDFRETYNNLLQEYSTLSENYYVMRSSFYSLNSTYLNLQSQYNNLSDDYNITKLNMTSLTAEIGFSNNMNYILLTTTILFTLSTVYLSRKKKNTH
jgi:photosystem II stability/assembly factor-like uncharacterized protein